jgi:outer membrane lipoprotein-sorting protein
MKKLLLILPFLFATSSVAEEDWHAREIHKVEAYLSALTTIVADFNQVAPDGNIATGKFYLKRPGKMRWQYNPPTPVLLVSNGKTITYFDAELDQVNYVPLDETLAGFLTQPTITMNSSATKLTDFQKKNGVVRVSIVQRAKPDEGMLTLELTDKPLQLKQMKITDAAGGVTSIQLQNAQYGPVLKDSLFVFIDPRGVTPRKRR